MDAINPLYLVNVLIGLTLAICVAFVAYGRDRNLSVWALAFTLYPLAFFLFGFRSSFPFWVSIVFGNAALLIMFALFSEGMCRLNDLKLSRLWIWGPTPFSILGMIYLINDFETRTFFGAALTVYHSVVVLIIVKMSMGLDEGRGRWLIYGAAVCSSVMFITRVILMMLGQGTRTDFLEPGFPQTVLLSLGLMWLIMLSIGLLVKYKERAESAMLRLALHDPLTQLGNRRVLNDRLSAAFQFSRLNSLYGAFMVLDLDILKNSMILTAMP